MLTFGFICLMLAPSGGESTWLIVLVVLGILFLLALAGSGNRSRPRMRYCPYCGGRVNYPDRPRGRRGCSTGQGTLSLRSRDGARPARASQERANRATTSRTK
jgi:hypothetical protein